MRVRPTENSLALAAVDIGDKYMRELGQRLSCPHNAHSGSRDLPRGTGGLPGEVEVGCGSLWEDTDKAETRKIFLFVCFLFHFVLLLLFIFITFYLFFLF